MHNANDCINIMKNSDKALNLVVDWSIVRTTMDKNGRVVAILTPLPS